MRSSKRKRASVYSGSDGEDEEVLPSQHRKRAIDAMEGKLTSLAGEVSALQCALMDLRKLHGELEAQGDLLDAQLKSHGSAALIEENLPFRNADELQGSNLAVRGSEYCVNEHYPWLPAIEAASPGGNLSADRLQKSCNGTETRSTCTTLQAGTTNSCQVPPKGQMQLFHDSEVGISDLYHPAAVAPDFWDEILLSEYPEDQNETDLVNVDGGLHHAAASTTGSPADVVSASAAPTAAARSTVPSPGTRLPTTPSAHCAAASDLGSPTGAPTAGASHLHPQPYSNGGRAATAAAPSPAPLLPTGDESTDCAVAIDAMPDSLSLWHQYQALEHQPAQHQQQVKGLEQMPVLQMPESRPASVADSTASLLQPQPRQQPSTEPRTVERRRYGTFLDEPLMAIPHAFPPPSSCQPPGGAPALSPDEHLELSRQELLGRDSSEAMWAVPPDTHAPAAITAGARAPAVAEPCQPSTPGPISTSAMAFGVPIAGAPQSLPPGAGWSKKPGEVVAAAGCQRGIKEEQQPVAVPARATNVGFCVGACGGDGGAGAGAGAAGEAGCLGARCALQPLQPSQVQAQQQSYHQQQQHHQQKQPVTWAEFGVALRLSGGCSSGGMAPGRQDAASSIFTSTPVKKPPGLPLPVSPAARPAAPAAGMASTDLMASPTLRAAPLPRRGSGGGGGAAAAAPAGVLVAGCVVQPPPGNVYLESGSATERQQQREADQQQQQDAEQLQQQRSGSLSGGAPTPRTRSSSGGGAPPLPLPLPLPPHHLHYPPPPPPYGLHWSPMPYPPPYLTLPFAIPVRYGPHESPVRTIRWRRLPGMPPPPGMPLPPGAPHLGPPLPKYAASMAAPLPPPHLLALPPPSHSLHASPTPVPAEPYPSVGSGAGPLATGVGVGAPSLIAPPSRVFSGGVGSSGGTPVGGSRPAAGPLLAPPTPAAAVLQPPHGVMGPVPALGLAE